MEQLVVYPEPPPPDLARTLDLGGFRWKAVASAEDATAHEPPAGWAGGIVACDTDPEGAWAFCRSLRKRDVPTRLLLLLNGAQVNELELRDDLYDDFCLTPFHPVEVEARLRHPRRHQKYIGSTFDSMGQSFIKNRYEVPYDGESVPEAPETSLQAQAPRFPISRAADPSP